MEPFFEFENEYDEKGIFGRDVEKDLEYLLNFIHGVDPELDKNIIERAFRFCVNYHQGVIRKSGYPYYTHPLNVLLILLQQFPVHDLPSIVACLLHDTIEDVESVSKSLVASEFSDEIAEIVDAVTKIDYKSKKGNKGEEDKKDGKDDKSKKEQEKAETYRKLFLALVKDVRVILIKLADRLHNLRTLHYLKPEKQFEVAIETLNFYVPFAHRLGLSKVKMELENRSFYYVDRSAYEAIRDSLNTKRRDFINYIKSFTDLIQQSLRDKHIESTISIVHKHEYEIYQMTKTGKNLSEIDNFYSLVVILHTDDVHECYRAHGVLANAFHATGFADYVANPKIDWFRSLNTELFGPDGKRVEILIRTEEMEKIAEEGFAASFTLKSGRIRALKIDDQDLENWGSWMQDIVLSEGEKAPQIIWESIKVNLFDGELNVYTKDATNIKLPQGASLLDFAFAVDKELGMRCISGKVNGTVKNLNYKLKNNDQVEIISSPNSIPSYDWLNSVVTHRAVYHLHNYFKNNPHHINSIRQERENYDVKLRIKGEDRDGMLLDITASIGSSNIRRVNLYASGDLFEGAITIHVKNDGQLNEIFAKLLIVKGVTSVERIADDA